MMFTFHAKHFLNLNCKSQPELQHHNLRRFEAFFSRNTVLYPSFSKFWIRLFLKGDGKERH